MTKQARFPKIPDLNIPGLVDQRLTGAACAGHAPLFDAAHPGESTEHQQARHHRARAICAGCPIRSNCQEVARQLPTDHRTGIWAGQLWKETA